jgi:hypothetical protein
MHTGAHHPDSGKSWMRAPKGKSILIYEGDLDTNDVDVYDYSNGKLVGTLTGFQMPAGGCVDEKGDVYIANYASGTAVKYAHGGTKALETYSSRGQPLGCAVDAKGDLAVTSFSPAQVTVYAGGDPAKGTTYTSCAANQWTMGYDNKGNLIGVGQGSKICALLKGAKSVSTLSTKGITIDYPGGTTWDGKYIALADQQANRGFNLGIYRASLSGSTLTSRGETILTCATGYTGGAAPFILGSKNTPVNDRQAKVVVGVNIGCGSGIGLWHYPKGAEFKDYTGTRFPNGLAVSIGESK